MLFVRRRTFRSTSGQSLGSCLANSEAEQKNIADTRSHLYLAPHDTRDGARHARTVERVETPSAEGIPTPLNYSSASYAEALLSAVP
jgi:hypothetical protein